MFAALTGCALVSSALALTTPSLPIVDLGYERHQAAFFNETGGYYSFANIRYAEPPLGNLRFSAPVPPRGKSRTINNGSVGVICPQASTNWFAINLEFAAAYLQGLPFDLAAAEAALQNSSATPPPLDPRTTEDCLFLDVVVPQKVFAKATPERNGKGGAAVLVWIYGGGFTGGEKAGSGNPAGLIKASQVSGSDGVIYVSFNYRLGAFGWLAGPTLQSNGTANAGLYDQRLALQWVQDNIHLFGGDRNKVTIFGESAGGSSVMHQITAFAGLSGPVPFSQAIAQSPGFQPIPSSFQQEQTTEAFLSILNVSSIQEARQLSSSALIAANAYQISNSTYGSFTYGPVVDGLFAPALPGRLLLQGSFDKTVKVMVGYNADEGLLFTNPSVTTDTAFSDFVQSALPDVSPSILTYITTALYPPIFDGSYGYTSNLQRSVILVAEAFFTCNTYYLDRAYLNQTYAYLFSVPPALHGQDIPYTYFNGPSANVLNDTVAVALQEYITSFATNGTPSGPVIPNFPLYGNDSTILNLNITSISEMMDPSANARCVWWQKALYF
ncbi:hypothetical protein MMC24_005175 [Lignoscripta atroalba]|nr:hypothetical protein [Lignoscripta atroalba]